jgi:hypothetical protein
VRRLRSLKSCFTERTTAREQSKKARKKQIADLPKQRHFGLGVQPASEHTCDPRFFARLARSLWNEHADVGPPAHPHGSTNRFRKNRGYGAAIQHAWQGSDAELLAFLDADGNSRKERTTLEAVLHSLVTSNSNS